MKSRDPADPSEQAAREKSTRDRWRSVVLKTCMQHAGNLDIVTYGRQDLTRLPSRVYAVAKPKCLELLDWACHEQLVRGRSPDFIEQEINSLLWEFLKPYSSRFGQAVAGETRSLLNQP